MIPGNVNRGTKVVPEGHRAPALGSLLLLLWFQAGCGSQPPAAEPEPEVQETAPSAGGALLYRRYCASCHGPGGRGDGPVAELLTPPPPDLTLLASRNGGTYPLRQVMTAIDGERTIRAHGDSDMPVWGEVLAQELEEAPFTERTALLHIQAIAEHIGSLQRAP